MMQALQYQTGIRSLDDVAQKMSTTGKQPEAEVPSNFFREFTQQNHKQFIFMIKEYIKG